MRFIKTVAIGSTIMGTIAFIIIAIAKFFLWLGTTMQIDPGWFIIAMFVIPALIVIAHLIGDLYLDIREDYRKDN